jgi:hypothetical protein
MILITPKALLWQINPDGYNTRVSPATPTAGEGYTKGGDLLLESSGFPRVLFG